MTSPSDEGAAPAQWDPVLPDAHAIADYIASVATDYVSHEFIAEYFRDAHAVLRQVPIETLEEGDPDHNIADEEKERRYEAMDLATMPPIVVLFDEIEDGNHRYRVAKRKGATTMWCYVVEYEDEDNQED